MSVTPLHRNPGVRLSWYAFAVAVLAAILVPAGLAGGGFLLAFGAFVVAVVAKVRHEEAWPLLLFPLALFPVLLVSAPFWV